MPLGNFNPSFRLVTVENDPAVSDDLTKSFVGRGEMKLFLDVRYIVINSKQALMMTKEQGMVFNLLHVKCRDLFFHSQQ
jgi:hypothetical protein